MDSVEFLDAVRELRGLDSDNKLAAYLGINRGHLSQYRTRRRKLDPRACEKIALALGVDSEYVLASVQAERAKRTSEREAWLRLAQLAKKAHAAALAGFAILVGLSVPSPAEAANAVLCILCKLADGCRNRSLQPQYAHALYTSGGASCTAGP